MIKDFVRPTEINFFRWKTQDSRTCHQLTFIFFFFFKKKRDLFANNKNEHLGGENQVSPFGDLGQLITNKTTFQQQLNNVLALNKLT